MPAQDHRAGAPAQPGKVSRRQTQQARAHLATDALSSQERRRFRKIAAARDAARRRKKLERRHQAVVLAGALVAMAIVAVSFALVPAINAARGQGTRGTFTVQYETYSSRAGATWVGTFRSAAGEVVPGVAYQGSLPSGARPGSSIPALYQGGSDRVYAPHGSHVWVDDLLVMLVVGGAVGLALWISPLGLGRRKEAF
jgi:hypothetical protein